jgi:hypothetical protein
MKAGVWIMRGSRNCALRKEPRRLDGSTELAEV